MKRVVRVYLSRHWAAFMISILAAVASAGLTVKLTAMFKPVVDSLGGDYQVIIRLAAIIGAIAIGRGLVVSTQTWLANRIGQTVVGDIQADMIARLVHADLGRLRSVHSGGYVSSLLYDADKVRDAVTTGAIGWIQHGVTTAAFLIYMVWLDPWLTLLTLLAAPLSIWVMQTFSRRTARALDGAMTETASLSRAILEAVDGIKIVKLENREDDEQGRVETVIRKRQRFQIKGANARNLVLPVTEMLMTLVVALMLAYIGWRSSVGHMTAGSFAGFMAALLTMGQSVRQLSSVQPIMAEAATAAKRLFEALDVEAEIRDGPEARAVKKRASKVAFENVSFRYGDGPEVLGEISLEAVKGETIALVGPSGGGKSTILNLIPRFYDATAGRVLVDGADIRGLKIASLREQIALVTQEPFLFDDTLRANIAYAKPVATDAEIIKAAKAAAAHDFITALPGGYDAQAGEAGTRLSGGQRQRIAIARAFLKDAPILLLDEATSALDTESEAQVQAALDRLMKGRATMVIAHRLSTVRGATRIYVIEAGKVVETGTHAALVRKKGLYARLAASQNLDAPS